MRSLWQHWVTWTAACSFCLIMQGRFNLLESGLHIFEVILLLKIGFFFYDFAFVIGWHNILWHWICEIKKKNCNRVLCKFLQSFQNENSLKYFQTCLPESLTTCAVLWGDWRRRQQDSQPPDWVSLFLAHSPLHGSGPLAVSAVFFWTLSWACLS